MALTDLACRTATCPPDKARVRVTDAGGLYLEVSPVGSKRWFWKYYFKGKEKRLSLGSYSEVGSRKVVVSLAKARDARDRARLEHRTGIDPVQRRRLNKLANGVVAGTTFEAIARELHTVKRKGWSEQYADRWIERMEKDLFPWIGGLPIKEITDPSSSKPFVASKVVALTKPRTRCGKPPDRCFGMRLQPDDVIEIRRLIYMERYSRSSSNTSRRYLSRQPRHRCCVPSEPTKARR